MRRPLPNTSYLSCNKQVQQLRMLSGITNQPVTKQPSQRRRRLAPAGTVSNTWPTCMLCLLHNCSESLMAQVGGSCAEDLLPCLQCSCPRSRLHYDLNPGTCHRQTFLYNNTFLYQETCAC